MSSRAIVFENRVMCLSIPSLLFRKETLSGDTWLTFLTLYALVDVLVDHLLILICDVLGIRHGHDSISHEKHNEDHAARRMSEAVRESAPTLIDISRDFQSVELAKDESLLISGMLVGCVSHLHCLV